MNKQHWRVEWKQWMNDDRRHRPHRRPHRRRRRRRRRRLDILRYLRRLSEPLRGRGRRRRTYEMTKNNN